MTQKGKRELRLMRQAGRRKKRKRRRACVRDAHLFCRFFLVGGRSWVRKELFLHRFHFITLPDSCWEIFKWKRKWICSLQVQESCVFFACGGGAGQRGAGGSKRVGVEEVDRLLEEGTLLALGVEWGSLFLNSFHRFLATGRRGFLS